jgi:alkaline phosphatase D
MKHCAFLLAVPSIWATGLLAAEPATRPAIPDNYKRLHQDAMRLIFDGKLDQAIQDMTGLLEKYPADAEAHYALTVALAQAGRIEEAVVHLRKAVQLGLPPERFAGGTLTGLEPLADTGPMRRIATAMRGRPIHGPMLGAATGSGLRVWVRTATAAEIQVIASTSADLDEPIRSPVVRSTPERDFTAVVPLTGLKPDTEYHYIVVIDGHDDAAREHVYTFRTAPAPGRPGRVRIAFGGGAGYVLPNERVWDTVRSFDPRALVMLGDNVYIDTPEVPAVQHYTYYRRQARPEFRRLVSSTFVYAIYDDHDFGTNDCSGGPAVDDPPWKPAVLNVFRNNWVNPYYASDNLPGCWFDFQLADIHFIMLDGRYYRASAEHGVDPPTMLGPVQKRWLLNTLSRSKAPLTALCSPVPWTFLAKGDSPDTWNGFRTERDEIFNFLADNHIDGVVLLSADRHRSDLWRIDRPRGYDLYEFSSSRFTNQHVHATMPQAEFSYNVTQSFGLVDFDTTVADPTVTYRIITIDGKTVFTFTIKRSELSGDGK